jgi:hypothetical protein
LSLEYFPGNLPIGGLKDFKTSAGGWKRSYIKAFLMFSYREINPLFPGTSSVDIGDFAIIAVFYYNTVLLRV